MSATINECQVRYLEISDTLPRNVRYISYSRYMGGGLASRIEFVARGSSLLHIMRAGFIYLNTSKL